MSYQYLNHLKDCGKMSDKSGKNFLRNMAKIAIVGLGILIEYILFVTLVIANIIPSASKGYWHIVFFGALVWIGSALLVGYCIYWLLSKDRIFKLHT